ncbi:hypothetical protein HYW61_00730 [candidate division WWE3 bacterium]|nr:hypothetical protein [candidate division WWE3 bacterium]
MNETILFQTSLIAAFLAGMVALFAPCCVSYLLPAYFGSVFKERKKVLLMTLIYSLGIFLIMIPAVLGSRLISLLVFRYHTQIYLLGGLFMIVVGAMALLGIKMPVPHLSMSKTQETDPLSVFTLGIFSGITSACCAPVLVGVLTLSFLSPTMWQALLIGFIYVLGMVTPLYIGSYFLDSKKVLGLAFFKRRIAVSDKLSIAVYDLISFLIFTITGLIVIYLALATDFSMVEMASGFSNSINRFALTLNSLPAANYIFLALIGLFVFVVVKQVVKDKD